jgi:hypothetical protein
VYGSGFSYFGNGLMYAMTPWSGYFEAGQIGGHTAALGTVLGFEQNFAAPPAVGFNACSLEASMRVTNSSIPLGRPRLFPLPL